VRESQDANTKIRLESDAVNDSLTGNNCSAAPFRLGGAPERLRHYFSFVVVISCRGLAPTAEVELLRPGVAFRSTIVICERLTSLKHTDPCR
jgi:hypothetical protein